MQGSNVLDNLPSRERLAALILESLAELRYGSLEITVHDGRVVHIETRSRQKLDPALSVHRTAPTRPGADPRKGEAGSPSFPAERADRNAGSAVHRFEV